MNALDLAYEQCRRVHRRSGRTYYLATRLLPAWKRRHVHALYGVARYADEIVDNTEQRDLASRREALARWSSAVLCGLSGRPVADDLPGAALFPALLHTVRVFDLRIQDFRVFYESMAMDLTVGSYETYQDLLGYMEGSAAAIGTLMLPILQAPAAGPAPDHSEAREPARQLGFAFQLTNFIRDVAEDLERGRVYLPAEDLDLFGVRVADLQRACLTRRNSPAVAALIQYEVARARNHYMAAAPGIDLLAASSRPAIRAASLMYQGILDTIERQEHDVFARRAVVSTGSRLRLVARAFLAPGAAALTGQ